MSVRQPGLEILESFQSNNWHADIPKLDEVSQETISDYLVDSGKVMIVSAVNLLGEKVSIKLL